MSHDYNTRTKKESVVSSECLQILEANIINNINSLKDEIISLKDTVIKTLQEENEDFVSNANTWRTELLL